MPFLFGAAATDYEEVVKKANKAKCHRNSDCQKVQVGCGGCENMALNRQSPLYMAVLGNSESQNPV